MEEAVYKIVELTGSSKTNIESAIQNAISRAAKSLRNIRWFQVSETRGFIENARISYWQATIKVGFNVEENETAKPEPESKSPAGEKKKNGQYRCKVCGYIYDPARGDPSQDIKPGTSFEDLPESWKCPECGVGKEQFEKIN